MKVLLLADPNSVHTIKWAKSLAQNNIDVFIFGMGLFSVKDYDGINNISVRTLNENVARDEGVLSKISYLKALPIIKEIIKKNKPDILHAHYVSSYGLLGALSKFHPFILSVWGSDVFDFPNNSFIHKTILKYNLRKADKILSTSEIMAKETQLYTKKSIEITPFGINTDQFTYQQGNDSLFDKDDIVIGTIKSLEPVYGIEYLIKTFKIVSDNNINLPLKLLIVGSGSLEKKLKGLVKSLNIEKQTIFTGKIPHSEVTKYLNMLSIFVALSKKESFGVSVIEASACEKPVVVSNVGGLPEVVDNNNTGFVVTPKSEKEAAKMIERLVLDQKLRTKMGKAGRERVKKLYNWDNNVKQMITIYNKIILYD